MVTLKFSNRALYTIIVVSVLIVSIGIAYAYGTSTPATFGHDAGELTGVCKTDGTGCPTIPSGLSCRIASIEEGYPWSYTLDVSCNAGETMVSGGCKLSGESVSSLMIDSYPLDADTWRCRGETYQSIKTAYAICCTLS